MTLTAAADLELIRASRLLETDPAMAARRASEILMQAPGHQGASLLLATALGRLGDPAAAIRTLEELVQSHGDSAFMRFELARAYMQGSRPADALAELRHAVELDEGLADGWRELAAALFAAGDTLGGDKAYSRYARLTANRLELREAVVAIGELRIEAAEALLRQRLKQVPDDVTAWRLLADAANRRDDATEAERCLLECLRLAPGDAEARFRLATLLHEENRYSDALVHLERLLTLEPDNVDYLSLKAQILRWTGANQDAIELMKAVVARHPNEVRAWLVYGHLLREAGQQAKAIERYRRALQVQPGSGRAWSSLANLKTFRFAPADLSAMQDQLARSNPSGLERTHLEFALGKAFEDEEDYAASFEHYARGNALYRSTFFYDAEAMSASARHTRTIESQQFFEERQGWGSESREPIFIVGLPRCGSTLLEQMLATHSQVEGTRELTELPALAEDLMKRAQAQGAKAASAKTQGAARYPAPLADLERSELAALADRYLELTAAHRKADKPRFVDKMLANYAHIGLIQLMFPGAAIIDVRRHPLGSGFSCYKQIFARGNRFSYDLRELGRYSRDYIELLRHFDQVLPGRVHRVYYEELISDPQPALRSVLEYCGLPYEEHCLRFYENPRIVQTISSEQVRRPIYTESVDQWRHYEPWLGPLKESLGDVLT